MSDVMADSTYRSAFHEWARKQVDLLTSGRTDEADLEGIIEELEALDHGEPAALRLAYASACTHILLIELEPNGPVEAWEEAIARARTTIASVMDADPTLLERREEIFARAHATARISAAFTLERHAASIAQVPTFDWRQVEGPHAVEARRPGNAKSATRYDEDFSAWAMHQGATLRYLRPAGLDVENIAEEIEALARTEAKALRAAYATIGKHFLLAHGNHDDCTSTAVSARRAMMELRQTLADSPSLSARKAELFAQAYPMARLEAAIESGKDESAFPETPPFTIDDAERGPRRTH